MSITASEMTPADIAAVTNNGGSGSGFGWGGDGGWWIILLFLFMLNGGWGNGFGGGCGGFMPWMYAGQTNTNNDVQRGFDQNYVMTGINGIQNAVNNGFGNVSTQLCNGFAGVNQAVSNGFAQAEIAANSRQMADMNQMFGIQSALQQCCCDNRAATADLKYTVATEACNDRAAVTNALQNVSAQNAANTNTLLNAINGGIQSLKDQNCQYQLEQKNDTIAQLRSELMYSRGQASQDVQTARILAGQNSEIDAMYNRLRDCPVGTMPVYGNQPIFTCPVNNAYNNSGCGCGCAA